MEAETIEIAIAYKLLVLGIIAAQPLASLKCRLAEEDWSP